MGFSKEREQEQAVVRQFLRLLFGLFGLLLLLQFRLLLISLLLSVLLLLLSLLLVLLSVLTIFLILIHNLDFLVVGRLPGKDKWGKAICKSTQGIPP